MIALYYVNCFLNVMEIMHTFVENELSLSGLFKIILQTLSKTTETDIS